jgi:hypothetical protein
MVSRCFSTTAPAPWSAVRLGSPARILAAALLATASRGAAVELPGRGEPITRACETFDEPDWLYTY